jgi:pyruvate,orthophosphate dikinase
MTRAGLPYLGFRLSQLKPATPFLQTAKKFPDGLWEQVKDGLREIEKKVGKRFGDGGTPSLFQSVQVRRFSMPGMMDTVLNLGLNEVTVKGLATQTAIYVLP